LMDGSVQSREPPENITISFSKKGVPEICIRQFWLLNLTVKFH